MRYSPPSMTARLPHVGVRQTCGALGHGVEHARQVEVARGDRREDLAESADSRSSASLVSSSSPTRRTAIPIWSGNVSTTPISRSVKWLDVLAPDREHADRLAVAHQRHAEQRPRAGGPRRGLELIFSVGEHVWDLNRTALHEDATSQGVPSRLEDVSLAGPRGTPPERRRECGDPEPAPLLRAEEVALVRVGKEGRPLDHRLEEVVEIEVELASECRTCPTADSRSSASVTWPAGAPAEWRRRPVRRRSRGSESRPR